MPPLKSPDAVSPAGVTDTRPYKTMIVCQGSCEAVCSSVTWDQARVSVSCRTRQAHCGRALPQPGRGQKPAPNLLSLVTTNDFAAPFTNLDQQSPELERYEAVQRR